MSEPCLRLLLIFSPSTLIDQFLLTRSKLPQSPPCTIKVPQLHKTKAASIAAPAATAPTSNLNPSLVVTCAGAADVGTLIAVVVAIARVDVG